MAVKARVYNCKSHKSQAMLVKVSVDGRNCKTHKILYNCVFLLFTVFTNCNGFYQPFTYV